MLTRPEIVVLTQADTVPPAEITRALALFPAGTLVISAVTGEGLQPLIHQVWATLQGMRGA